MRLLLHTYDPHDGIFYKPEQLIGFVAKLGYDAISKIDHYRVICSRELAQYAWSWGILLIPGADLYFQRKDALTSNITQQDVARLKSLSALAEFKQDSHPIIASTLISSSASAWEGASKCT